MKIEIEGDSAEAVALALLHMVAEAEGKLDGEGAWQDAGRDWILDTYAECLRAVDGDRDMEDGDEEEDEDEEDELGEDVEDQVPGTPSR